MSGNKGPYKRTYKKNNPIDNNSNDVNDKNLNKFSRASFNSFSNANANANANANTNANTNANINSNTKNYENKNDSQQNNQDVNNDESQTSNVQKVLEPSASYVAREFEKWDDIEDILSRELLRGIYAYGFDNPSPIQQKSLLTIFDERDIIAQAQSGTGKTGAFTIGALHRVNPRLNKTQAMILAPTRELAKQIHHVISSLGSLIPGLRISILIGGTSTDSDTNDLKTNVPHIIVGCPGRVFDMLRRQHIISKDIKLLILDEADEMLSAGFKEQIYNIFQYFNSNIQVGLFSATMPPELQLLTDKFMRDPIRILVKSEMLTLEGIKQYYVALNDDNQKYITLKDLFKSLSMSQCIIYCNSIKRVRDLTDAMLNEGFPVCCIHSDMDKVKRDEAYRDFRAGKQRVLISSNVTARGIDIQQVSTVLNFDLPKCIHTYLHRIGRSGRWGRKGNAINFVTRWDMKKLREIEGHYNTIIDELPADIKIE